MFADFCRDGPLQPYLAKARWICPSIHPFLDLTRVFYAGLPRVGSEDKDEEDQEDKEYVAGFSRELVGSYGLLAIQRRKSKLSMRL